MYEDMTGMDQSFAHTVLEVDQLWYASSIYDKDEDAPACIIGREGDQILRVDKGRRVIVPSFPYKSSPLEIKNRIRQEEELVISLLDAITWDAALPRREGKLSQELLVSALTDIESLDLRASTLIISPDDVPLYASELSVGFPEFRDTFTTEELRDNPDMVMSASNRAHITVIDEEGNIRMSIGSIPSTNKVQHHRWPDSHPKK